MRRSPLVGAVRALVATFGIALALLGLKGVLDGMASREWDAVTGVMAAVDGGVSYAYRVADEEYASSRVRFAVLPSLSRLTTASSSSATGTRVEVHYDPANPARAVLEPGVQRPAVLLAAVGGFLFLLASIPWPSRRRDRAPRRVPEAEGLIPSLFAPTAPDEEQGWSRRTDLDRSKRSLWG